MTSPATGSFYSVGTFVLLAAIFVVGTGAAFGWDPVPSDNRTQSTLMLLWYALSGFYAMKVGRHRDVSYGEALRRGAIDIGRDVKAKVLR